MSAPLAPRHGQAANDQAWEVNKEAKEIDESRCNTPSTGDGEMAGLQVGYGMVYT